jgi:hypothetical protein
MVHRDVKPSNVLFAGGDLGRLKLIDFGVARRVRDEGSLTNTGTAMGTPGYMAPEQARGSKRLDARADVFALGCLLYECLTGRPAFSGEHEVAVMAKIVLAEVPELRDDCPEAPEALAELLRSMLDKDPARRAADGRAVARALGALGPLPEAPRRSRRMLLDAPTRRVGAGAAAPTTAQSVVLAANLSPTQEELEDALLASLRALAASHQATLEVLADGSVIANLDGEAPVEVATRAARLGLALRALLADRALVIATSRREAPVLGDAIDRGTRILGKAALESIFSSVVGDRPQGVRLDEVTSGLLDAQRFEVARAAGASYLVGERASP